MAHLYPLYRECLRLHAWLLGSGLVGLLAARVFGVTELGAAMYVAPFFVMFLILPIVSGNLNWILSLPLSKNAIMLQVLLLNFANLLFCLFNIAIIIGLHYLLSSKAVEWPADKSLFSDIYDSSPGDLAFWIFVLCFGFTLLFPHRALLVVMSGKKTNAQNKVSWKYIAYILFSAFLLPVAFAYRFVNPMVFSAALILIFPAASMANTMTVLGFSGKYRRLWVGGVLALSLFGVIAVYAKAARRLHHPSSALIRYEASSFLGALEGRTDYKGVLEDFLREDLPPAQLDSIISTYGALTKRSLFFRRENWLDQRSSPLKFSELLKGKSSRAALRSISVLFDPRYVSKEDLYAYLREVRGFIGEGERDGIAGHFWVYVPLEPEEVLRLLESKNFDEVRVGLSYARFHPRREYFEAIVKLLPKEIPEELIPAALQTLNTQSTLENSMREFAEISRGKVKGSYTEFRCEGFDPETTKNAVELNFCIRRLSLAKPFEALSMVEPYLFRLPLNATHAKAIKGWKRIK